MANRRRAKPRPLREILRLRHQVGMSARAIARSLGLAASSVRDYLGRAQLHEVSWPLAPELDDEALEKMLFRPAPAQGEPREEPDFAYVHRELRRKHVTKTLLWMEYREQHPDGYAYSRFCERYAAWKAIASPVMRQTHAAGEKLFVDFSGKGLYLVDPATGECRLARLFVAVLGASNYTYVEPILDETLRTWVRCHANAFEYIGGVSRAVVPDNLKSGITGPDRYEPLVNSTYQDLARHYGTAILPARPRKPKDKAKVEQGVLFASRWILAALRNRTFYSLDELRRAVWPLLERLNDKRMQRVGRTRRELFEELERAELLPLPPKRYVWSQWARGRVNIDYHVAFEDHFYSVPYQLCGKEVELRATDATVEILRLGTRVASHVRSAHKHRHSTLADHMPSSHRAHAEWTPSRIIEWARTVGPSTATMVEEIMRRRPHPEQGFRSCLGLMRLKKSWSEPRLEAACARAVRSRAFSYKSVVAILRNNLDRAPEPSSQSQLPLPLHDNVRGGEYYH